MSKRDSLRRLLLSTSVLGLVAGSAQAAPVGSPYYSAITALSPFHYYPLDEAYASPEGTTAANLGSSGLTEATYIRMGTGLQINDGTLPQGTGMNSAATIGATVGPTVMNKFTLPENYAFSTNFLGVSQESYKNQLPGFAPNLGDPGNPADAGNLNPDVLVSGAAGVNRAFEGNLRAAIRLNSTAGGNSAFQGDAATGAFTWAGWIRLDNGNTSSTVRIFDTGGNNTVANGNFFQITSGGSAGMSIATGSTAAETRSLKAFYPSGSPAGSVGGDRGVGDSGQWYFIIASTSGATSAQRIANLKVWERYADKTNAMGTAGTSLGASNELGIAKLGYRDLVGGFPGPAQGASDKMDEIAMWNRVLQYDERESLYVSATQPAGGAPLNTTNADGNWAVSGGWTAGIYPLQHGQNNTPYFAAVVDHNILATTFDNGTGGTASFRSNVASLTVNAGKTLTLDNGATIRSFQDIIVNGNLAMNGDNGVFSNTAGTKDFNVSKAAVLDSGRALTLAPATAITMASPSNQLLAEGNLTIGAGTALTVNPGTNLPASGAKLYTVAQADSNQGSGSALQEAGALSGTFNLTLNQPVDGLGRRFAPLYENRAANGVGTVDTFKIGFALPGDLDFDNDVDFGDAFELTNNYGLNSGATWRNGDFFNDGAVDFTDAFEQTNNYGATYATTPGTIGDAKLTLVYNSITGALSVEGPAGEQFKSLSIASASGQLNTGAAGWLGAAGVGFTSNTVGLQGFATNTALGQTFLISSGYAIGAILAPGISEAVLLQDLTIQYGIQGLTGTRIGDLNYVIPEPSVIFGSLMGTAVFGLCAWRNRSRRQKTAA